jgi:hypothetical protein
MEKVETIIPWINIDNQLPPKDMEYEHDDGLPSVPVLVTDGWSIYTCVYYYTGEFAGRWMIDMMWCFFVEVKFWCLPANILLPVIPKKVESKSKKYTLRQLRKAWGSGFHEGSKTK